MANIITIPYFQGQIDIAQSTNVQSAIPNTVETIFIPQYENEYLTKVLGYAFATAFVSGIAILPTPETRWTDLLNGVAYSYNDKEYIWTGFQNSLKLSPIAQYIYFKYMENQATTTVTSGEAKNKLQNADAVTAGQKMWRAWYEMVTMNRSLYDYLNRNKDTYPEWDSTMTDCSFYALKTANKFQI